MIICTRDITFSRIKMIIKVIIKARSWKKISFSMIGRGSVL
jgi:hypothetical protein